MTNLTEKETMVLEAILTSEYGDGKHSIGMASVWVDCLWTPNKELGEKAVGGVLTSLQKKGYALVFGDVKDSSVGLTEAGYAALLEVKPELAT